MVIRWNYTMHLFKKWVLSTCEAIRTNTGGRAYIRMWSCSHRRPSPSHTHFAMPAGWCTKGRGLGSTNKQPSFQSHVLLGCLRMPSDSSCHHAALHVNTHLSKTLNPDFRGATFQLTLSISFLFVSYKTEQTGLRDSGMAPNQSETHPELALCPKV